MMKENQELLSLGNYKNTETSLYKIIAKIRTSKSKWLFTFFGLAWTAGPVTYIALQAASHIGLRQDVSNEVFIYFAIYTLVAGIFALCSRLINNLLIMPSIRQADKDFTLSLSQLFDIYFALRNEIIQEYNSNEQPYIAAWWVLKSGKVTIDTLQEAVRDITQSEALVIGIQKIEYYRRNGYISLIEQEYAKHEQLVNYHVEKINAQFPALASLLQKRFQGYIPANIEGEKRPDGFIEHLASAGENNNKQLATSFDVLAFFQLIIELLLGRNIIVLYPKFHGFKDLEIARAKFDEVLSDFRLILRQRNGQLRVLINNLADLSGDETSKKVIPINSNGQELLTLLRSLLAEYPLKASQKQQYKKIVHLNKKLNGIWAKLTHYESLYNKSWQKNVSRFQQKLSCEESMPLEVSIGNIALSDSKKLLLSRKISMLVSALVEKRRKSIYDMPLSSDECKDIAIDILNILDEKFNISEPEEQFGLETSNEADLGGIYVNDFIDTRIEQGHLVVENVKQSSTETAYKLLKQLVIYFNIPLNTKVTGYFSEKFGLTTTHYASLENIENPLSIKAGNTFKTELLELPKV